MATTIAVAVVAPTIDSLPDETFLTFMRKRGKIGGQHKVPRVLDAQQLAEIAASITRR